MVLREYEAYSASLYRLVTTIDGSMSAFTRIQNEIGNLKAALRPSEDMKIEALLARDRRQRHDEI
jgi:hypothetical protein